MVLSADVVMCTPRILYIVTSVGVRPCSDDLLLASHREIFSSRASRYRPLESFLVMMTASRTLTGCAMSAALPPVTRHCPSHAPDLLPLENNNGAVY